MLNTSSVFLVTETGLKIMKFPQHDIVILYPELKIKINQKWANTVVAKIIWFLIIARDGEHVSIFPNKIQWQILGCGFKGVFVILI